MKTHFFIYPLLFICVCLTSCQNKSLTVWEDTKTVGRYIHRKSRLLWNRNVDSKMIESEDQFYGPEEEEEYIPINTGTLQSPSNTITPQPKHDPGAIGSPIPGIEQFQSPSKALSKLFQTIHFKTNEHTLTSSYSMGILKKIAEHINQTPALYVFISGHCDERASEAYNLSLGTRRANTIRQYLIENKVNPERLYTISWGKELPVDPSHSESAWEKNRRVEFKIFDQKDSQ